MRKYFVYADDGQYVYKFAVPACSKKLAENFALSNGEVIAVKDVTDDFPISATKLADALKKAEFGDVEIDFIIRVLNLENFLVD